MTPKKTNIPPANPSSVEWPYHVERASLVEIREKYGVDYSADGDQTVYAEFLVTEKDGKLVYSPAYTEGR